MTVVDSNSEKFIKFYVEDGLKKFRKLITEIKDKDLEVEFNRQRGYY